MASVWEIAHAFGTRGLTVSRLPLMAGSAAVLVAAYRGGLEAMLVAVALTGTAVVVWRLLGSSTHAGHPGEDRPHGPSRDPVVELRDVTASVLAVLWLPFLAGFAMLLLAPDDGPWRIFTFVVLAVASDVGGYTAGVLFGKHPMAPTISPKKSWEGLAGSVISGVVVGTLAVTLGLGGPWWVGVLLGLVAVATATVGDLSESVLKRDLGIKDMGSLLPGHGGVLDRLDSLLLTAPVVWLLLTALVPPPA